MDWNDSDSSLGSANLDRLIDELDVTRLGVDTCEDIARSLVEIREEATDLNDDTQMCVQGSPGT